MEQTARRYMDIKEAHIYTSIPISSLYKKVEAHEILHIRDGKKILFDAVDLDAHMAKRKVKPKRKSEPFYIPSNHASVVDTTANP